MDGYCSLNSSTGMFIGSNCFVNSMFLSVTLRLSGSCYDSLHRSNADPERLCDAHDAMLLSAQFPHLSFHRSTDSRSAKLLPLCSRPSQSSIDSLNDHRTLEFSKHVAHLKQRLASRRRRAQSLLRQVKV
jgi:hypothetical protein